jgi:UTP--glucose-1-phosphate uridylyltransferase
VNSPAPRIAVFPVAGLGTRFLPATKSVPKEMLPVLDRPLIAYAVEDAHKAGIRHFVFVTSSGKPAIEHYFADNLDLGAELERNQKADLLAVLRDAVPRDSTYSFVRQEKALGLGHAVYCARPLVGDEAFAVLLPDELMLDGRGELSATQELVHSYAAHGGLQQLQQ